MHHYSNVLYDIKKQSFQRSSPHFHPNSEEDDIRKELNQLRTQLRAKDTQIIRMQGQIDDLQKKIILFQFNSRQNEQNCHSKEEQQMSTFSEIPMILQNKELKENNEQMHRDILYLNGKNNDLEAKVRQANSDIEHLTSKLKELNILQKMREERFQDELQKLTPIIVEDNKDFAFLKEGILKLINFLRQNVLNLIFGIFLRCAKECENQKKVNSFSLFKNYWVDLKGSKNLGLLSVAKTYQAVKKLTKMLQQSYAQLIEEQYRDTMNQWVINTLVDIKHTPPKQPEQKLFRLLGLFYRSKYPIKGQNFDLALDLQVHFEDLICQEMAHLLMLP